jgi:cellulose synthase/poly-beta-1,6-N-acetylglucosamine synthase-like glycosyltransferase
MEPTLTHPYIHVGSARDLTGRDRLLYRLLEILPGALSYGTLLGFMALSFFAPKYAAYFTIAFSIYWLLKTLYLSMHLRYNFKRLRHNMSVNWRERLAGLKHDELVQLVIFPFYTESYEVAAGSVRALASADWDKSRLAVVIAAEERAGKEAHAVAERLRAEFGSQFLDLIVTIHPKDVPGELAGKGSNIAYAAREARTRILDKRGFRYEDVLVSAFDIDTVVYEQYFTCLAFHYLTAKSPERVSLQPVPLYNNNIWDAPTLSRVLAYSSTFWQMVQQERPEKLATFSSHALSFKALHEAGYWQKNIVSEDSRIYWNLFVHYDGDYEVVPISYPVSMDANVGESWWKTVLNLYKQHRRWTWGVENVPYIMFNCLKSPKIPRGKKWRAIAVQLEGFWSLATSPLILFLVGWMPLIVGGHAFNSTVLSYNLPIVVKGFLTLAMVGLIFSAVFAMALIPERPQKYTWRMSLLMVAQWILVPFTMVFFSAVPGLETQARLMTARYMGFWVTPKERAKDALQAA